MKIALNDIKFTSSIKMMIKCLRPWPVQRRNFIYLLSPPPLPQSWQDKRQGVKYEEKSDFINIFYGTLSTFRPLLPPPPQSIWKSYTYVGQYLRHSTGSDLALLVTAQSGVTCSGGRHSTWETAPPGGGFWRYFNRL